MTGRPLWEVKNDPARSRPHRHPARRRTRTSRTQRTRARLRAHALAAQTRSLWHACTHKFGATGINSPLDEDINTLLVEV